MNTFPNISLQTSGISAGDTPWRIDTPNGYFSAAKMHYYVKDYQGNVRQVTDADGKVEQDNHYYPYGMLMAESSDILAAALGSSNKDANPYLFGSKEYLTTAGSNLLDFTARTYDPSILLFLTPDPKATKFTSYYPYLYCGADPVNRIDIYGLETICLTNIKSIRTYAENVPDNPDKLTVYSHGNYSGMDYTLHVPDGIINSGLSFIDAVNKESNNYKDIQNMGYVEIELKACNTGAINPEGKPNLAEKISKELPNAIVTAPTGEIETNYTISNGEVINLSERVLDENHKPMDSQTTRTYFRGNEIDKSLIPTLKYPIQCMSRLMQRPAISKDINSILLPIKNISKPKDIENL